MWKRKCVSRGIHTCVVAAFVAALTLSSCGSANDERSGDAPTPSAVSEPVTGPEANIQPEGAYVSVGKPGAVGTVVVSQVGMTLYHFEKDKKNSGKTACYGACVKVWTPYLTYGRPRPELYARGDLLGTIKRRDGSTQVTYAGLPLYLYASDGAAKLTGAGKKSFGAYWHPISVNGEDADRH